MRLDGPRSGFSLGPRGIRTRRLTGEQRIQGNQLKKEKLIRHVFDSSQGMSDHVACTENPIGILSGPDGKVICGQPI